MSDEQDWSDKKADEVVEKILSKAIGLESWDKEDWSIMKLEIMESLREASKTELPEPKDIQAIRTIVAYERQKDGSDKKKLYVDYEWLQKHLHYIEKEKRRG